MTLQDWAAILAHTHFSDPAALAAGVVAVVLVGLSKGGMGGAFALMGVPVLALVMPPMQAAALMLPILLAMDAVGLRIWWGRWHRPTLTLLLPPAILGIGVGWLTATVTSEALVRLLVGLTALGFMANLAVRKLRAQNALPTGRRLVAGWLWGSLSGFTSFVAHAGGPPFQVFVLPMRMDPKLYTGTSVMFFAVVNVVKVAPYAMLAQFDPVTMQSAAVMLPVAVVAVLAGAAVVKRMRPEVFYPFMYVMVTIVGLRLVSDGLGGLGG